MKRLMKMIGRLICLTTVAVISLPCWTTTAAAQNGLPDPVYPVIHDKAWYDDPANVAPFTWTDEQGVQHENKVSDPATNPMHIIALLSYVYTNPKIPGIKHAIPDSAGMQCYRYIPTQSGWGNPNGDFNYDGYDNTHNTPTYKGYPVRTNNLSTTVDYTRHVRDTRYTGDVQPGDNNYDYERQLSANTDGLRLWAYNNPYFTIGSDGLPVVEQPEEHGLTVFLVKMKDSYDEYEYDASTGKITLKHGSMPTAYPSGNDDVIYGISASLYNSIASEIESVRLLTNAVRVEDADSRADHNSGTLYSVDEPDMNRFYFISKGTPRQSVKMPTKPLFEEFSPISSMLNGWEMKFNNELMEGKIFTMMHDCSSVPEQAHAFSMHGLNPAVSTHRDMEGVCLWVPDYRMEFWEYDKGAFSNYNPASREGFGRDLFKFYGNGNNGVYRVIRYFNYNPQHAPSLAQYTCKLAASAQPYSGTSQYEHPYNVNLDWSTTVSRIAGSNDAIPEDFDVYLVVDGVREPEPLFSFAYGQNGYCQVNITNSDLSQGEAPASKSRTYEHNYQVQQYEDHGYWLTYQIAARVHSESEAESFFNVLSNTDRVWIPPYEGTGAIKLNLEVNTSSVYDREKEVNRYVNTINIVNNPGNPLKMGDVFMRPNNQGWNPDHVNGGGMPNGGFESNSGSPSWQWQDNNMGSEIIVYRFDTSAPTVKTPVARVYFNCLVDGPRFRFAVGRRNQAESAEEGEYIYTNDDLDGVDGSNARPWNQSCNANSYNDASDFPFTYNHGYALGSSSKTGDPNYYFTKGLMVTDVFEASTASNDHPAQYGYIAEFHKYSNPDAASWGYTNMEYRSTQVTADVYKSNSESYEHTFTKDEVDGDQMHELELDYKAGLTVNNMLYLPEITKYQLWTADGMVESRAERDTPNTYLVFAGNTKVGEPGQFQSVVTIPDNSREADNIDHIDYVPVITAQLPERSSWMTGDGTTTANSTYGSNYHGTDNNIVELLEDKEHEMASNYVPEGSDIAPNGSATEHASSGGVDYYGSYLKVSSDMSSDLEVYGVRVWRVREMDRNGNAENVLVNEWFNEEGWNIVGPMPESCYFDVQIDENTGKMTVALKDAFSGPNVTTFQGNDAYQPQYIVRFYARLKSEGITPRKGVAPKAGEQQAKTYYVSEDEIYPNFSGDIPTSISEAVLNGQIESVTYYDELGRISNSPFKGMNIVVTRYIDGTTTIMKMIKR